MHRRIYYSDSSDRFRNEVAPIISDEATGRNILKCITPNACNYTVTIHTEAGLPPVLLENEGATGFSSLKIQVMYYPKVNVWNGAVYKWTSHHTLVNHSSGDNRNGTVNASSPIRAFATKNTYVVPADVASGNPGEMVPFRNMLMTVKNHLPKLREAGNAVRHTLAATATRALDSQFGKCIISGDLLQGLLMLILSLPCSIVAKRKSSANNFFHASEVKVSEKQLST